MVTTEKETQHTPSLYLATGQIAARYGTHRDTVRDWIVEGLDAPDGRRVKLQAKRIGGRWKSTLEWVEAFFALLRGEEGTPAVAETPAAAEKRARAEQEQARKALGGKKG